MQKLSRTTKAQNISLLATLVLVLAGLVSSIFSLKNSASSILSWIPVVVYFAIVFYGSYGYRIPHGNLLKYTMLIFAASVILSICTSADDTAVKLFLGFSALLIAFACGRLNRFNQMIIIGVVVLVAVIVANSMVTFRSDLNPSGENDPQAAVTTDATATTDPAESSDPSETTEKQETPETTDAVTTEPETTDPATTAPETEPAPYMPTPAPSPQDNNQNDTNGQAASVNNDDIDVNVLGNYAMSIQWLALLLVYGARYSLHKEAGLAESTDSKEESSDEEE